MVMLLCTILIHVNGDVHRQVHFNVDHQLKIVCLLNFLTVQSFFFLS